MRRSLLPALILLACNPGAPADVDASSTTTDGATTDGATTDGATSGDTSTTDDSSSGDPAADTHDTDLSPVEFR